MGSKSVLPLVLVDMLQVGDVPLCITAAFLAAANLIGVGLPWAGRLLCLCRSLGGNGLLEAIVDIGILVWQHPIPEKIALAAAALSAGASLAPGLVARAT